MASIRKTEEKIIAKLEESAEKRKLKKNYRSGSTIRRLLHVFETCIATEAVKKLGFVVIENNDATEVLYYGYVRIKLKYCPQL